MKRFVFKLDTVLQLRNQHERKAINQHAQALHRVQALRQKLDALQMGLQAEHRRYQEALTRSQSISTVQGFRSGFEYFEQHLTETQGHLSEAEAILEKHKDLLTSARREREVLEKYKDRLAGVHAQAVNKHDQLFLDELSLRAGSVT
jgi:flagellar protein FliJ